MTEYFYQLEGLLKNNLGDVIQGLAAKKFLPPNAKVLDREKLSEVVVENGFLIANGWYQHQFNHFPPPPNLKPFYISVHIAKSDFLKIPAVRKHFELHSPIGCRDSKTLKLFRGFGIPAYYSGCLTITFSNEGNQIPNGKVLLVDNVDHPFPDSVLNKLKQLISKDLEIISHNPIPTNGNFLDYATFNEEYALSLFEKYKQASLIITSKIHCALPCLGLGTPVLLIHPEPNDPRLETFKKFSEVTSYQTLLASDELPQTIVNKKKLNQAKKMLDFLTLEAIHNNGNPFVESKKSYFKFKNLQFQLMAKTTSKLVKLFYKLGIKKADFERVFGKEYLIG